MKQTGLLALLLFITTVSFGQQLEYSVHLNSGLFRFAGKGATHSTGLILGNSQSDDPFTYNPYGKKAGLCYGLAAQVQKVNSKNLIFGLQAGYETLSSKVKLSYAYTPLYSSPDPPITGETVFRHAFINAYPFIGKRVNLDKVNIDLNLGLDLAYGLSSLDKSDATSDSGQIFKFKTNRDKPDFDTRVRIGLTANYRRYGLTAGYAYGLQDYPSLNEVTNHDKYARLIRFGLAYKL